MINNIKQAIASKLSEVFTGYKIYDEDIPQNFKKPSFLITVIDQNYGKRLNNKYKSTVSFDLAYFSDKGKNEIKSDCQAVQVNLLRTLNTLDTFRVQNLQANITDNVLHITFDVSYSEIKTKEFAKMQKQTTNTNL